MFEFFNAWLLCLATRKIEMIANLHIGAMQMYRFMRRVKATDVRPTDGVSLVKHRVPWLRVDIYQILLTYGHVQRR